MTTFLFTLTLFAVAMIAMAVGVILSDRQLQGSCGGIGSEDCLCSLEKRRACAKEDLAKRAEQRAASDEVPFFDMAKLKGRDRGSRPDHPH